MNRRLATVSLCAFSSILSLGGCQKTADQQQSSATDANSSSPSSESARSAPKAEAPRPRPIVVPADTVISVVLDEPVGSKISTPGQNFAATVSHPIEVDGRVAVPKGARATGIVKDAKPAGRFKGGAALELTLTILRSKGPITTCARRRPWKPARAKANAPRPWLAAALAEAHSSGG